MYTEYIFRDIVLSIISSSGNQILIKCCFPYSYIEELYTSVATVMDNAQGSLKEKKSTLKFNEYYNLKYHRDGDTIKSHLNSKEEIELVFNELPLKDRDNVFIEDIITYES